jgi:hypothetical protein
MIINHQGKITLREQMIKYLLEALMPTLETIVTGRIYKKP